jgi:hypothetical protein
MVTQRPSDPAQQPERTDVACPVSRDIPLNKPVSKRLEAQKRKRAVARRALQREGLSAAEIAALIGPARRSATATTKRNATAKKRTAAKKTAGVTGKKSAAGKSSASGAGGTTDTSTTAASATRPARKRPARVIRHAGMRSAVARLESEPRAPQASNAGDLVERVSRAIERELEGIERIVGGDRVPPSQRTEAERRARTLASLARTLSEVMKLRAITRAAATETAKPADDDTIPRDLDEFRRELSRRLEFMVAAAAPVSAAGDDSG